jgi:hypothetical protein
MGGEAERAADEKARRRVASCRTAAELRRCLAETIRAVMADRIPELEANAILREANRALDEWGRRGRAGEK